MTRDEEDVERMLARHIPGGMLVFTPIKIGRKKRLIGRHPDADLIAAIPATYGCPHCSARFVCLALRNKHSRECDGD